jgi:ribonuclease P protein component
VNQTFAKPERIRRRADYLRIQESGRKLHSASFVCFGVPTPTPIGAAPVRFGITVSRRVGGAVVRNRVKRLLREAFRRHKQAFPSGLELVVIARAEAARAAYTTVERELCEVGRRFTSAGARVMPQ